MQGRTGPLGFGRVRPAAVDWRALQRAIDGNILPGSPACHALLPPRRVADPLTFATVLATVKPWGRIRGGRTPGVQPR